VKKQVKALFLSYYFHFCSLNPVVEAKYI